MPPAQLAYEYPRTYRVSAGWRVFFAVAGTAATVAGALGTWYFGTGHEVKGRSDTIMMVTVSLAFLVLGLLLFGYLLRLRLTLYADRIELQSLFSAEAMFRDQLKGRRRIEARNAPSTIALVNRNGRQLKISGIFRKDQALNEWFLALPDLDLRDLSASEQQIAGDIELGVNREERLRALHKGRKISTTLTVATLVSSAWGVFLPHPYELAVMTLVILPWIALFIAWQSRGLFRVDERKNDVHPSIAVPFMLPGFILALIVISRYEVLDIRQAIVVTVIIDLLLCAAAALVDSTLRSRFGMAILFLLLSTAYGFGAGMSLNVLFDGSENEVYRTTVVSKRISSGRRTSYYLKLEPWGPKQGLDEVSVGYEFYRSMQPDSVVCVGLRQGALKIAWYRVGPCQ